MERSVRVDKKCDRCGKETSILYVPYNHSKDSLFLIHQGERICGECFQDEDEEE